MESPRSAHVCGAACSARPMQRQRDRCVLGAFSALEPVSPKGGPTHATLLDEEAFATAK